MSSHRNLFAWQLARRVVLEVHRYAALHWTPNHSAILEQLRRAALSVQLNIAEGFASGPGPRCRYHLRIAYGSAVESTDLIELLLELAPGQNETLAPIADHSRHTQAVTLLLLKRSR